jgi:predicted glycosyltransferase
MDDADTVKQDWREKGVYEILQDLYAEIWVYGNREFYDPVQEYDIAESISQKMFFTGYIPRKIPGPEAVRNMRKELGVKADEKLVVVTTGGGGDGYALMRNYVSMLESAAKPLPFKSVLITGPFMPKNKRRKIFKRARKKGVRGYHFYRQMEKIFAAADLVVCMGGYNSLCEILSQGTPSLVIPREAPRKEQLIRAQAFKRHGLVDYIAWGELTPQILQQKIMSFLEAPETYLEAISQFRMNGIETMQQRLREFRPKKS